MCVQRCKRDALTNMTVVKPDPVAVIFAVTFHGVICEVTLGNLIIRIYHNLKRPRHKTNFTLLSVGRHYAQRLNREHLN